MLKKVILAIALAVFTVNLTATAAPAAKTRKAAVNAQATPKTLVKAFFTAVVGNDINTIWNLLSPSCKDKLIKQAGSKAKAIAWLQKQCNDANAVNFAKKMLSDETKLNKFSQRQSSDMIKIKGKWYINNLD